MLSHSFGVRPEQHSSRLDGTLVSATTHAHVGNEYCVELFVIEGTRESLSGFVNAVRAVPDVRTVDYSITSFGDDFPTQPTQS
jgi:CopG family nickel-responsive transcriptional regulator